MNYKEIYQYEDSYPPLLREIMNPPAKIYIRGELPDFKKTFIAIVGTRKATRESIDLARKTARSLAERGFVIVSGLAMGIDTAAHEGAISNEGMTVAVLGNGIDFIYPAQNENLGNKILKVGGTLISEYPPSTPSMPHQFLERNRIVAGLSIATIVIEAPKKSGAIVTARLAAESGREVFVFPGSAGHPQYAGSHALIRDGARLVDSIDDILEDLSLETEKYNQDDTTIKVKSGNLKIATKSEEINLKNNLFLKKEEQNHKVVLDKLSDAHKKVFALIFLHKTELSLDKISEYTKLSSKEVNQIIGEFTIYGIVEETADGYKLKN